MKSFWSLIPLLLCCGCVAGPEDFVSKSTEKAGSPEVVTNESSVSEPAGIKQASNVKQEQRPAFTTTSSGLKYRVLNDGKGRKPNANSTVTCHYKGWLDNGDVFDSSYGRSAATFPLNGVIKGWTEGLQLIQEGGAIELEIPSSLGYGPSGSPPKIPGGATLHFEIELFKVR